MSGRQRAGPGSRVMSHARAAPRRCGRMGRRSRHRLKVQGRTAGMKGSFVPAATRAGVSAEVVERAVFHAAGEGVPLAHGEVQAGPAGSLESRMTNSRPTSALCAAAASSWSSMLIRALTRRLSVGGPGGNRTPGPVFLAGFVHHCPGGSHRAASASSTGGTSSPASSYSTARSSGLIRMPTGPSAWRSAATASAGGTPRARVE